MRTATSLCAAPLFFLLAGSSFAQDVLYAYVSPPVGTAERAGASLASAGDVDGDGLADLWVGAPGFGASRGRVFLLAGGSGDELLTIEGTNAGDELGRQAASLGDVDGDGVPDLVAGAPSAGVGGVVRAFSGADGTLLWEALGGEGDKAGRVLISLTDHDGDGRRDVAVAALTGGRVQVRSGVTGALLSELVHPQGTMNAKLVDTGDLNGDGHADLVVEAKGLARAYSGTGAHLFTIYAEDVVSLGDWNGDGFADFLARTTNHAGMNDLHVVSGREGGPLHELQVDIGYLAPASDLDGDGRRDYYVRVYKQVSAHSSADGAELWSNADPNFEPALIPMAELGDLNADGRIDYALGYPWTNSQRGMARVFLTDFRLGPWDEICPGGSNHLPAPARAGWEGALDVAQNDFGALGLGLASGRPARLLASRTPIPSTDWGDVCLGPEVVRFPLSAANAGGVLRVPIDLQDFPPGSGHAVAPGETWYFQFWFEDGAASVSNTSSAIRVRFE